jgi:hypothetical protein
VVSEGSHPTGIPFGSHLHHRGGPSPYPQQSTRCTRPNAQNSRLYARGTRSCWWCAPLPTPRGIRRSPGSQSSSAAREARALGAHQPHRVAVDLTRPLRRAQRSQPLDRRQRWRRVLVPEHRAQAAGDGSYLRRKTKPSAEIPAARLRCAGANSLPKRRRQPE